MSRLSEVVRTSVALAALLPLSASAGVFAEQPLFDAIEVNPYNTPIVLSGPSVYYPPQGFISGLSGTLKSATFRYDMRGTLASPEATTSRQQVAVLECADGAGCSQITALDPARDGAGGTVIINDPEGEDVTVDFTNATKDFTTFYSAGYPLDPSKKYQLRMQGEQMLIDLYGTHIDGKFNAQFRLEGDLATTTATTTSSVCTERCNSNVMFLPGIQASRLYRNALSVDQVWEPNSVSGGDAISLDMTNGENTDSIYTVPGEGVMLNAYNVYPIYRGLSELLSSVTESDQINDSAMVVYDWRLDYEDLVDSGSQSADGRIFYRGQYSATTTDPYIVQELKNLAASSRTGKVTIVAHSNGGLLAKEIVSRPQLATLVDRLVFIGSPQLGTPKAIGGLLHGYQQALPKAEAPIFLSDAYARALGQTMPIAYNLLPSGQYFEIVDAPVVSFSTTTLQSWVSAYGEEVTSVEQLRGFMTDSARQKPTLLDVSKPEVVKGDMFDAANVVHAELDQMNIPDEIEVITIAGWGEDTLSGIRYENIPKYVCAIRGADDRCVSGGIAPTLTAVPQLTLNGDGTVVSESAQWSNNRSATQYWLDLHRLNAEPGSNFSHANLTESAPVLELLSGILTGSSSSTPQYITTTKPARSDPVTRLLISLYSPLTLGFTDSSGRYTGSKKDGFGHEVPGVTYERYGDVQVLVVPKSLSGIVSMQGLETGSFAFDVREVTDSDLVSRAIFAGIQSSTSTVAQFSVDSGVSPTRQGKLQIDYGGDGVFENVMHAIEGGMALPDTVPPEIAITVSTSSKDLAVSASGEQTGAVVKTSSGYEIRDGTGNVSKLFVQKQFSRSLLSFARVTGINFGTSTFPANASFLYVWDSNVPVSQTVSVNGTHVIEALYDKKRNKTVIVVLRKGLPIQSTTLPGLRLISVRTSQGSLIYSW